MVRAGSLIIVIPARGGSKRLPGKNLKALAGRTLMERTADAIGADGIDAPVLLTTDDDAIADAGRALGWRVPFRRPASLAEDEASTEDTVVHALDHFAADAGADPDFLMLLQVTSPFRPPGLLRRGLDLLAAAESVNAVLGVKALARTPASLFRTADDGTLHAIDAEDRRSPVVTPNGAFYLVRTAAFRAARSFAPPPVLSLPMDGAANIDIDTEDDWRAAETIAAARGL